MVDKLTDAQKTEFQGAFDVFKDDNGNIPNEKLYTIMKSLGQNIPDAELQLMIQGVDTDGSGEIDIDEFLAMMAEQLGLEEPDESKEAFKVMDAKIQGTIQIEDLKLIIADFADKIAEDQVNSIFLELDPDGLGTVDLRRFKRVFCF